MVAFRRARIFPICGKENLRYLVSHLRKVHNLSSAQRFEPLLRAKFQGIKVYVNVNKAKVTPAKQNIIVRNEPEKEIASKNLVKTVVQNEPAKEMTPKNPVKIVVEKNRADTWNAHSYTGFKFKHPFSMLVVGPTSCGKTHFVRKVLETPELKPFEVEWCYNQPQKEYEDYAVRRGNVRMKKGLPDYDVDDLHDLNKKNRKTVIVIDDLMEEAKDSKLVSKLFTQGRHRNVSVILILQNAFPKGKFNTEISRNAMYMVLFRSPADREQIKRVGQRMFPTRNDQFMNIYRLETEKPYGYILIDNKPETMTSHQVLSNIFNKTLRYDNGEVSKRSEESDKNKESDENQMVEMNVDSLSEVDDEND